MSFKNILYLCGKIVFIMALNLRRNFKTYYSIREVAEMFDLNESTLRYWEQEFTFLKPKTSGTAKIRQYQEKDIEQIRLIHNLVKVRGFKISAARDILQKNRIQNGYRRYSSYYETSRKTA